MADKPAALPEWDSTQVNAVVPDATHKAEGWLAPAGVPEKPAFQTFNYWQNNVYNWDAYFEELTDALLKVGRSQFAYVGATQLSIAGGGYYHHGTKSQVLLIDSTITHIITSPGVSQYHYIYLDDSAIVTAATHIITGSEVINSTTPPTYSVTKKGWYNGDDLCIFAVYIDSGGDIEPFTHSGDTVNFHDPVNMQISASGQTSNTDYDTTLWMPAFSRKGILSINTQTVSDDGGYYWSISEATAGIVPVFSLTSANDGSGQFNVMTDATQKVILRWQSAPAQTITNVFVWQVAWFFPVGM